MEILDGKLVSEELKQNLKEKINSLGKKVSLAIVQVGNREDSNLYIKKKKELGEELGVEIQIINLPFSEEDNIHPSDPSENLPLEEASKIEDLSLPAKPENLNLESSVIKKIEELNEDENINGILLQLPLPENINTEKVINSISDEKDVDGLKEGSKFVPATIKGIINLLERYKIDIEGERVVIVGHTGFVGKQAMRVFKDMNCDVEGVDINTKEEEMKEITKSADILIVAVGSPKIINSKYIEDGVVIIDVGINKVETKDGKEKIVGDVDFEDIKEMNGYITPVPGGVGPMTVVSLFENLVG